MRHSDTSKGSEYMLHCITKAADRNIGIKGYTSA
jgi:hypothetical protein